jgi:predicted SAM-dependent methyltransferase
MFDLARKKAENLTVALKDLGKTSKAKLLHSNGGVAVADNVPGDAVAASAAPEATKPAEEPGFVVGGHTVLRQQLASTYLQGNGIEIGALHNPLAVSPAAHVTYVDRLPVAELRQHYPTLADYKIVEPDILDNGEVLSNIADCSQDFLISNHFIEHCQDPIGAFINWFRVVKPGGTMFVAVPDMRFTFDRNREITPIQHLLRDHTDGPAWSKQQHLAEWALKVYEYPEEELEKWVKHYDETNADIHFHVWTQTEIYELMLTLKKEFKLDFDIVLSMHNDHEVVFILKKNS